MMRLKRTLFATSAGMMIACLPVAPAAAGGPGIGPMRPWGFGHGLIGAVVGLATLPLALASAVVSAAEPMAPVGYPMASGFAPAPGYAAGYYPSAGYYAPHPYYAPRQSYGNGYHRSYRPAGFAYRHR